MSVKYEDGPAIWRAGAVAGKGVPRPEAPAIILHWPKYLHNVGQIVRLASAFGIRQVWYSGNRIMDIMDPETRLPREERMKAYSDVMLINHPDPLTVFKQRVPRLTPIAVELRPNSEKLPQFEHPADAYNPVYIFGPEDGSLPGPILKQCFRFVVIPSHQCLNLATSVACVLYDRMAKSGDMLEVQGRGRAINCTR